MLVVDHGLCDPNPMPFRFRSSPFLTSSNPLPRGAFVLFRFFRAPAPNHPIHPIHPIRPNPIIPLPIHICNPFVYLHLWSTSSRSNSSHFSLPFPRLYHLFNTNTDRNTTPIFVTLPSSTTMKCFFLLHTLLAASLVGAQSVADLPSCSVCLPNPNTDAIEALTCTCSCHVLLLLLQQPVVQIQTIFASAQRRMLLPSSLLWRHA